MQRNAELAIQVRVGLELRPRDPLFIPVAGSDPLDELVGDLDAVGGGEIQLGLLPQHVDEAHEPIPRNTGKFLVRARHGEDVELAVLILYPDESGQIPVGEPRGVIPVVPAALRVRTLVTFGCTGIVRGPAAQGIRHAPRSLSSGGRTHQVVQEQLLHPLHRVVGLAAHARQQGIVLAGQPGHAGGGHQLGDDDVQEHGEDQHQDQGDTALIRSSAHAHGHLTLA